jgi:hypothetical protein
VGSRVPLDGLGVVELNPLIRFQRGRQTVLLPRECSGVRCATGQPLEATTRLMGLVEETFQHPQRYKTAFAHLDVKNECFRVKRLDKNRVEDLTYVWER